MVYLFYLVLAPLGFVFTYLVAYPLAPILPLFAVQKEWWCDNHSYRAIGPVLPSWLNVFMTPDNTLDGDAGAILRNGTGYWAKVLWLLRNPAYSFAIRYMTGPFSAKIRGDNTIKDNDNAKAGWCFIRINGLFQFTYVAPIGFSRCVMGNLGWNIRALVDPNAKPDIHPYQATFACTPFRFSGFR